MGHYLDFVLLVLTVQIRYHHLALYVQQGITVKILAKLLCLVKQVSFRNIHNICMELCVCTCVRERAHGHVCMYA